MPSHDPAVKLQDLRLQHPQLGAKGGETRPCNLRHALVAGIRDNSKQLLNTLPSHRGYNFELGHVGADGIDHRGLLANEKLAGAMQHQAALLLGRLGLDKPHIGPRDRFADGLGVSGIVLLSLNVGLHIGRRHQTHRMSKRPELARPMMRRGTGLDPNQARWQLLEEPQNIAALQLTADDHPAFRINAVHLKYRLRNIETDGRDRLS